MKILIIHGPNLQSLGIRKPEVYGSLTLNEINKAIKNEAERLGINIKIFQTNYEGKIIDLIDKYSSWANALIINPAAFTHYSYAIRDCIEAFNLPTAEVHLSDISAREEFRKLSVIAPVCEIQIKGKGLNSYIEAMQYFYKKLS